MAGTGRAVENAAPARPGARCPPRLRPSLPPSGGHCALCAARGGRVPPQVRRGVARDRRGVRPTEGGRGYLWG